MNESTHERRMAEALSQAELEKWRDYDLAEGADYHRLLATIAERDATIVQLEREVEEAQLKGADAIRMIGAHHLADLRDYQQHLAERDAEIARLEEALREYADERRWYGGNVWNIGNGHRHGYDLARQALKATTPGQSSEQARTFARAGDDAPLGDSGAER